MDIIQSLNPSTFKGLQANESTQSSSLSEAKKEKCAKDFESVFIEKLFDEMQNTIGDWGGEQDGASKQIQGLFWLNLARDVSNNGGLGLWKDIRQSIDDMENNINTTKKIDETL